MNSGRVDKFAIVEAFAFVEASSFETLASSAASHLCRQRGNHHYERQWQRSGLEHALIDFHVPHIPRVHPKKMTTELSGREMIVTVVNAYVAVP